MKYILIKIIKALESLKVKHLIVFLVFVIQSDTTMTVTLQLFLTEIFCLKSKLIILINSIVLAWENKVEFCKFEEFIVRIQINISIFFRSV